jgi:hypothetical protein
LRKLVILIDSVKAVLAQCFTEPTSEAAVDENGQTFMRLGGCVARIRGLL